ncbi:DUF1460 domain-containing protein [Mycobacterium sp. 236(2023)]|uniref:DUF1460 domain-containing protein n=1 Tax=Mycobacterium sp. 236(2023) TaxID=3038163 RepID=UPI0024150FF0|nr:DUF1460 domain-containing protein [Mycobacterium sp. 236(2023)]MDG4666327.1 DUF1460 domain-containing protein [Mycobacterium sp. 236(2023)]
MSARWTTALRCALAAALVAAFGSVTPFSASAAPVVMSAASEQILATMLAADDTSAESISGQFLGTPYAANTLIGSADEPEELVVELAGVDCFTYADYVEALKRSGDRDEFIANLVDVRYKNGDVSFANRKHFFTDWSATTPAVATDVTASLSDDAIPVSKNLNSKDDGGVYLPGLPAVPRTVTYIPAELVDSAVVGGLRTGDYVGAYAEDGGLDVTHVGIFIDTPEGPVFRHASSLSAERRVVDIPLSVYLQTVPGIVVLRPVVGDV